MKKDLLIGELADMFNMTSSQIRYYEKEGLLTSYKNFGNGYHYFGFDEMQRLEVILLLRELGTSIKDIKELIGSFDRDQYRDSLKTSVKAIDREILELKRKKKKLVDRIKRMDSVEVGKYIIKYQEEKKIYLANLKQIDLNSPKSMYMYLKKNDFEYLDYSNVLYAFLKDGSNEIEAAGAYMSVEDPKYHNVPTMIIEEGKYLSHTQAYITHEDLFYGLKEFRDYIAKENIKTVGSIFYYSDMDSLTVKEEGYYISFFVKVDE